jgi:hypothetical protein
LIAFRERLNRSQIDLSSIRASFMFRKVAVSRAVQSMPRVVVINSRLHRLIGKSYAWIQ